MFLSPWYDRLMADVEAACLTAWRAELLADLRGALIEIGAGTGANLPHYTSVDSAVLCEPDAGMRRQLEARIGGRPNLRVSEAPAEALPFADATFDVAVSTLVLCSVRDLGGALTQQLRVLKPGGELRFLEHVAAHDRPGRLRWQRLVEPVWRPLTGGCHLTRRSAEAIEAAGFEMISVRRESLRKATPLVRPSVRGVARRPAP